MKLRLLFLLLATFITIFSCKNEPKSGAISTPSTPETPATPTPPNAAVKLQGDLKQEKPLSAHAIGFFTNLLWEYSAAIVIGEPEKSKIYKGKWIKFNSDNTIETGYYDGPVNSGNWVVDESKNIITIIENGERPTYTEWKIKTSASSDGIMVWVGTKRFGLNDTQIKMERNSLKPVRAE